ncbi:PTS glucose transporter subunit IIA [Acidaminococcus timonensis]|uniref:PTS sugar transporter subunit IIA n=1 Tax=Acidaminococcus timonensis TaxID=1871002 RepID=UPI0029429684|nr:PTS glucose transporter subunit IIA [Acidaminococcus timonensis]
MGFFFRKTKVQLVAPVTGSLISLEQVKDPAFAQKMLGDGVAFLPETGELVAPCDGVISYVPDTAHAIALTEKHGLEILLHIGLNTVEQQGRGFQARVKAGDPVKQGQVLLTFDRDRLQAKGCDLSTPLVITNGDKVARLEKGPQGPVTAGRDLCLTVTLN